MEYTEYQQAVAEAKSERVQDFVTLRQSNPDQLIVEIEAKFGDIIKFLKIRGLGNIAQELSLFKNKIQIPAKNSLHLLKFIGFISLFIIFIFKSFIVKR